MCIRSARLILIGLLLLVAACGSAPARPDPLALAPANAATTTATPTEAATATRKPTASHTPISTATHTPAATATPTATPSPTPDPTYQRLAHYAAALRPAAWQKFDPGDPASFKLLAGMTTYSLTVTLAPDLGSLKGRAIVGYTNQETAPLEALYLHLFPNLWGAGMTVGDLQVAGKAVTPTLQSNASLLKIGLEAPLAPGAQTSLTFAYASKIPTGEGAGNYGEFALDRGLLSLGHSYPSLVVYDTGWRLETPARQGDITFHDAALYDVALTGPKELVIIATGQTLATTPNGDGSATWRIVGGPMRDFNVIASADYRLLTGEAGDIVVNSYFLPGDESGGAKALAWAIAALANFEKHFGPYPYRELDLAAMPTKAGGIEYPGLVAIGARLYRSTNEEALFESVTVHEVAHQWWYNVVGNDQIRYPWLDEALTQYSTYLYVRDTYGRESAQGFVDLVTNVRWGSVGYVKKPIGLPAAAYTPAEYSGIIYGRGPLFFLALRDRLGEAKMAELLRRYHNTYAWRTAAPADFRRLAEQVAGEDLGELFSAWVD